MPSCALNGFKEGDYRCNLERAGGFRYRPQDVLLRGARAVYDELQVSRLGCQLARGVNGKECPGKCQKAILSQALLAYMSQSGILPDGG